jgi:predicted Zn-dependent peptidase
LTAPSGVDVSSLDSGLKVVTERMPGVRSAAIGFWVGTGSSDEAPALAGASHFLEHLLFKGTAQRSARSIAEAVDEVGGDMNAFTTKEYTAFYVRVLAERAELALDILSDIVWSPAFRPDEVEAERKVILEEIGMHADEPADQVHDLLAEALFPQHPLGREVLGDPGTITAMARDDIAAFHNFHYRPANVVVAAAGGVEHDAVVAAIAARQGDRLGGARPPRQKVHESPRPLVVVGRDTEQAHVALGMQGPGHNDEDRFAVTLIDHILGGGMSSRLFQTVREERGLAYSVYSYRMSYEAGGALAVYAGTAPKSVHEVLGLIDEELGRLADHGPTDRELDSARSHLQGATTLGLEDSGARMSRIGHNQLSYGRVVPLEEVKAKLDALSAADVAEVAAKLLSAPRSLAVVGPFDDSDFSGG